MTLDNTLNSTLFLYSEMNNEQVIINYGDSTNDTLYTNSGFYLSNLAFFLSIYSHFFSKN